MAVYLSPVWGAGAQLFDNSGNVLTGGKIYTYAAGTTTPAVTYTSSTGLVANTNPIIANAAGRITGEIWLSAGQEYKFILKTSDDVLLGTYDNISFDAAAMNYTPASNSLLYPDRPLTVKQALDAITNDETGSSVIGFIQNDPDAVGTTVETKLREYISVKDFGAVGDGVTDDTVAIQAAANSILNGGTLTFPFGTYVVTQSINIPTGNINLIGYGATIDATNLAFDALVRGSGAVFRFVTPNTVHSTTLVSTAAVNATTLTLTSATGAQEGDQIRCISNQVQYQNVGTYAYYNDQNVIDKIVGNVITLKAPLSYPLTVSPYVVTVTYYTPLKNITIDGFTFIGGGVKQSPMANGNGQCAVWANGVTNMVVKNCRSYSFQGVAFGFDGARDVLVSNCYMEGIPRNIPVVEGQNSSFYGAVVWRARGIVFTQCASDRLRHLYDASETYEMIQSNSIAYNTHRGAFGSHEETYGLEVIGNTAMNCYSGVVLRALTGTVQSNQISCFTNTPAITTAEMSSADPGRASIVINNNTISCTTGTNGCVQLSGIYDKLICNGNYITSKASGIRFTSNYQTNVVLINNTIDSPVGIDWLFTATVKNVLIQGNTFLNYTSNMVSMRGSPSMQTPSDNIKIIDNFGLPVIESANAGVLLRSEGYYGDYVVIRGNTQWGDNSTVVSVTPGAFYRIKSHPIVELNDNTNRDNLYNRSIGAYTSSASIPPDSTVLRGSVLDKANPALGSPDVWVVTSAGTEGTISGVTGNINSGSTTLTLSGNDGIKVYAGSYITIAGAGAAGGNLSVRVSTLSDDFVTATVDTAASTTVSSAAVTRKNPTIGASANLV